MKTLSRQMVYEASVGEVFQKLDDLGVTGTHMTESSMMMMGNKLELTFLSPNHTGLNSKYRWRGKMMGIPMDFTVLVTQWIDAKEKVWETVGKADMIIYSWYRMSLYVSPATKGTLAKLSITYQKPDGFLSRVLSFLFAKLYCIWCLNKMLNDAKEAIDAHSQRTVSSANR